MTGQEQWYALTKVTKDTEVCGEVYVELMLSEDEKGADSLVVTVSKSRDLVPRVGCHLMACCCLHV